MIKTVPQAIDDMAVSLGASPSAQIPTVSQALENVYAALGGTRTDLDTMVVSEVIDLLTPLIHSGGGGGDWSSANVTLICLANVYYYKGSCVYDGDYSKEEITVRVNDPATITIPLYKGVGHIWVSDLIDVDDAVMPTFEGSISFDENYEIVVTGDGSISMAGSQET